MKTIEVKSKVDLSKDFTLVPNCKPSPYEPPDDKEAWVIYNYNHEYVQKNARYLTEKAKASIREFQYWLTTYRSALYDKEQLDADRLKKEKPNE
jgi:hypothetical protein